MMHETSKGATAQRVDFLPMSASERKFIDKAHYVKFYGCRIFASICALYSRFIILKAIWILEILP